MRLLLLTAETCPTYRADVAALFGKYLPRHGVFSDIVTGLTPGCSNVEWPGGETYLCDVAGSQVKKHLKTVLHGISHLFRGSCARHQAIQVRDMPVLAALGLVAARIKKLPFYYWMSYPIPEGQIALARERGLSEGVMKFIFPWVNGRVGRCLLYQFVLPRADHVFVQSNRMKEDAVARGISPEKMTPVPMGVDLEDVGLADLPPADDERLRGRRVLVYLGTLDRPRRIEILFEVLAKVRRQVPEALLVLVGDTSDDVHRTWLHQQAEAAGVADAVLWTGWLPMKDGWRYVRAAEVALSPIPRGALLDCGSPTKVSEYLALGVPVVGNDNPDQEEVIRGSGAGLCVPFTADAFAAAVMTALSNGRRKISSAGTDYVRAHRSYEQISLMVAQVYERLSRK